MSNYELHLNEHSTRPVNTTWYKEIPHSHPTEVSSFRVGVKLAPHVILQLDVASICAKDEEILGKTTACMISWHLNFLILQLKSGIAL